MGGVFTHRLGVFPVGEYDPYFANTVALLSMDGTNGSTIFTDESAAARGNATVTGNAQVTTGFKKFGTGSLRLDGVGDDIKFADHTDWTLGTSDFTIEGWFSFDGSNLAAENAIATHYSTTSNQRGWIFRYNGALATDALEFLGSSDGVSASSIVSGAWTPAADTFYPLCAERSGNTFRIYAGGIMLAKATNAINIFNSANSMIIGQTANSANPMKGNVDEFRFTLGVARYASDSGYTVPTTAFPRS